jgi:hypothetical protein
MTRASLAMAVAAGIVACGQAATPANPNPINVSGVIDRGGPVASCPTDEPCDPPARAVFLVFSRPGYPDVRTSIGPTGAFALHLDPGAYSIAAAPPPTAGGIIPNSIRVPAEGSVILDLKIG